MNTTSKPAKKRLRGFVLTEDAFDLLNRELTKWWEKSEARQKSRTGKLSREYKAEGLGLEVKTVDKLYRREPVDAETLRAAFDKMNITPPFLIERYCVSALLPPGNLPHPPTHCIGRETQVAEILALLESDRLVTLTGAGGIGKTRLAIQVAEERKSHYAAGIWFVEFTGVADPALVSPQVAAALGVQEQGEQPLIQALSDFLRGKRLLLILDNCEHLLGACAMLLAPLFSSSPDLRVLATSRERLNIPGEHPYRVPSLSVPDLRRLSSENDVARVLLDYNSVRLFVERACKQRTDFTVTNQNAFLLASICHRLDGIPLALELAAGRMGGMSLEDLERELNDSFRILVGGNRAALPRHQTLRAAMDWSYHLLEENEKALLRRLSVFVGGYGREAAEAVCAGDRITEGAVLDLLTSLVDKSQVVYQEREGKARYHLLETIRQYAWERLQESGEREGLQVRHRDYFLALAEEVEPKLNSPEKLEWLARLESEHGNLSAALEYSLVAARGSVGLCLCGMLLKFWGGQGHFSEGRAWCVRVLERAEAQERTATRVKVLNGAGILASCQGDLPSAMAYHTESAAICNELGDKRGVAASLNCLTGVAYAQGDLLLAWSCAEETLRIFREIGDRPKTANPLKNMAVVAQTRGDYTSARAYIEESLSIGWETRDQINIASSLSVLGSILYSQGDYASAKSRFDESLSLCRDIGDRSGIAFALYLLGNVAHVQGENRAARSYYEESLSIYRAMGRRLDIAQLLQTLADFAARESKTKRAGVLWGVAEALREEIRSPILPGEREAYDRAVTEARATLDEGAFVAAWAQGRSLTEDEAIEYALEELR